MAIYTPDPIKAVKWLSDLGYDKWVHDTVVAEGAVFGQGCRNVAELWFNYEMGPKEFEIISYTNGDNWLARRPIRLGLSHLGIHVENMKEARERFAGFPIAQEVTTLSHTNPEVGKRRYHYVILETFPVFGYDIKLIERLNA